MKLANALARRSWLQKEISDLESRLMNNAKVQAGEVPAEDPQALLASMDACLKELEDLVAVINLANASTMKDGITLTQMLAKRDALQQRLKIMKRFLAEASSRVNRYSKSEVVIQSTVSVAALQKQVDACSKELRILDEKIQELNWTTEI